MLVKPPPALDRAIDALTYYGAMKHYAYIFGGPNLRHVERYRWRQRRRIIEGLFGGDDWQVPEHVAAAFSLAFDLFHDGKGLAHWPAVYRTPAFQAGAFAARDPSFARALDSAWMLGGLPAARQLIPDFELGPPPEPRDVPDLGTWGYDG